MPELPEVETIRLTLEPKLLGKTIIGAEILHPKLVQGLAETDFQAKIKGRLIQAVKRRGKYFILSLDDGQSLSVHLRMTGQLTVADSADPVQKATYLRLKLDGGVELRLKDQRKFARVCLFNMESLPSGLVKIGPEPLTAEFTTTVLQEQLGRRKLAIKKALLNQEIVAGIGNIYADEALFLAGIHPERPVDSLTESEFTDLTQSIKTVLAEGIEFRGTTKRDYRDGEGNPGSYQDKLRVYGRKGLSCPKCKAPIVKINLGGRGTHFCPRCQK